MPKITTETYRKFIRENKSFFNEGGLISIANMRQLIADTFGSNTLTLRNHLRNLVDFRLIAPYGSNFFILNKDEFSDLIKPTGVTSSHIPTEEEREALERFENDTENILAEDRAKAKKQNQ